MLFRGLRVRNWEIPLLFDRVERSVAGKRYLRLCRGVEVSSRTGKRVYVDIETDMALFRVDNVVHAVTNICPHKHEPAIYQGAVLNGTVTCPMHGWCFELSTGNNVGHGRGLETFHVMELEGWVWLEIP